MSPMTPVPIEERHDSDLRRTLEHFAKALAGAPLRDAKRYVDKYTPSP